jgi:PAS domain S-box-containing protein
MPAMSRIKTSFPGVYYVLGKSSRGGRSEKIFYIRYSRSGRTVEEKAGRQYLDHMTETRAAGLRNQKIQQARRMAEKLIESQNPGESSLPGFFAASDFFVSKEESDLAALSSQPLNEVLNAIFQSSSDGISVSDSRGTIIACNEASEKLSGIDRKDMVGGNVQSLVDKGLIDRSVTIDVLAKKRQVNIMMYQKKTRKHLLVTGTPVLDAQGKVSLVIVNERDITQLDTLKQELQKSRRVTERYRHELAELSMLELREQEIVAESKAMRQVLRIGLKLANLEVSNILLLGESGTGKGLLSKFIHQNGKRSNKPFIQINCAALPESLLEAELFGYEKGAFTGASRQGKAGLFELASGGTLFLDEIGDLPLSIQAKLLKCLDDQEFMRLGGVRSIKVDCIIIAATNINLERLVSQGLFRKDLYYRLNAFNVRIPSLRDRSEDIFLLARHFLYKYNHAYKSRKRISRRALTQMQSYPFPGNVRELKNILKKAVVMSEGEVMEQSIITALSHPAVPEGLTAIRDDRSNPSRNFKNEKHRLEKEMLQEAGRKCQSTRQMAEYLSISQSSVIRKLKKHGISTCLTPRRFE